MTLLLIAAFSPVSSAASNKKFNFLLRFFDMNEMAFAYHRHCMGGDGGINAKFLSTMEFVADALYDESLKTNPSIRPDYIKKKILERRYNIQYKLDKDNLRNGCQSGDSQTALAHYNEFSRFSRAQIGDFIVERTQEH